jgi:CheY-like chemotaxis protein
LRGRTEHCEELHEQTRKEKDDCRKGLAEERERSLMLHETVATIAEKALSARGGEDDTLVRIVTRLRSTGPERMHALRVLVVDDDEQGRRAIVRMVSRLGHRTLEAVSAFDALDVIASGEHIDIVVCDVIMPGFSGLELLEALRRVARKVAVIMVSGDADALAAASGVETLTKPISLAALTSAIERSRPRAEQAQG